MVVRAMILVIISFNKHYGNTFTAYIPIIHNLSHIIKYVRVQQRTYNAHTHLSMIIYINNMHQCIIIKVQLKIIFMILNI